MPITNLISTHLTDGQVETAKSALTTLETSLAQISVNLNADDRQKYGSINEQNKLFVNKVNDFHKNQSELQASDVDWEEFEKDFTSRQNYENMIARLESLITKLKSAKILHDYDNYQSALTDYAFTAYKAGTAYPGFEVKLNELKQFFVPASKIPQKPAKEVIK